MGIRAFVKAADRRKPRPIHPNWVELQYPRSPLDAEPDSPETIAGMLAETSKVKVTIDLRVDSFPLVHTVRRGETFHSVAKQFYDDAGLASFIASANLLSVDKDLEVGTILSIPAFNPE